MRRLRLGEGPRPSHSVWGRSQEVSTSSDVLGPTDHGGQGRRVLWTPLQGVPRGHAWRTLSPTIFNVFVDAVISQWVTVVTPTGAGTGGLGLTTIDLAAYFYTDDSLMDSNQTESLHRLLTSSPASLTGSGCRKHNKDGWNGMPAIPHAGGGYRRRPIRDG